MKRKSSILFLLALCGILTLSGCRKKIEETESETQSETVTETESETETDSEKETQKETQKKTSVSNKQSTEKKTVKPSTINSNSSTQKQTEKNNTATAGTEQCPYCFQQISLASNGSGSTIYAEHVAQEKAWADTYGWGDTPPTENPNSGNTTPSTDTPSTYTPATDTPATNGGDDSAQCGYCYQWFSVSDGTYSAHIAAHNADLGLPSDTEYVQCPKCGYSYPKGNMYDNHVCVTEQPNT